MQTLYYIAMLTVASSVFTSALTKGDSGKLTALHNADTTMCILAEVKLLQEALLYTKKPNYKKTDF